MPAKSVSSIEVFKVSMYLVIPKSFPPKNHTGGVRVVNDFNLGKRRFRDGIESTTKVSNHVRKAIAVAKHHSGIIRYDDSLFISLNRISFVSKTSSCGYRPFLCEYASSLCTSRNDKLAIADFMFKSGFASVNRCKWRIVRLTENHVSGEDITPINPIPF